MNLKTYAIALIALLISILSFAQKLDVPALDNPMSETYLKDNLHKGLPRLVLNASIEKELKQKMKTDPVLQNMYKAIQLNTDQIFDEALLERKKTGRRLLGVSREMLWRINMLAFVYRMEKDPKVLERINQEVLAVCAFSDWNPSHFLDVAEMALAVALALDWTAGDLPQLTIAIAQKALIEKGIKPSWPKNGRSPNWAYGHNNWNQVCNGGMIAASIAIAEEAPELAAKTIHRALDGLPQSLAAYMPDGIYPEGATYWSYGTSFSVATIAMLESAFGSDFGHYDYPGFKESAVFKSLMNTPSGMYYNFADCGDARSENGDLFLAWFATKSGNAGFFEKERFLRPAADMGKLSRLAGVAMVWLSQFEEKSVAQLPTSWKGDGSNPVVVFTNGENDPHQYYFGGKGGRGMVNHGNMDGGSFIFELDGVRWVVDPGNQGYHDLEKTGFDLWNKDQNSQRWTLLTKNNFGHSTLSVNDSLHRTEGLVEIVEFMDGSAPQASFDLTPTLGDLVENATRKFVKGSPNSLTIKDDIQVNDKTEFITWQLLTTADVDFYDGGLILTQDEKELWVENISHPDLRFSIVSLYPAPLELDRQMPGLKRLELRIPAWTIKDENLQIEIQLSGSEN